jgi:predicted  nucleic acid-binding Zn-ribbon protein
MKEELANLRKLQSIDDGIRSSDEQAAKLRRQLADFDKRLADLSASLATTSEDAKTLSVTLKKREHDLAEVEEHIRTLQVQLNTARDNKQFTVLRHEISVAREKAGQITDEVLKLMERIEGGDETIRNLKSEIKRQEGKVRAERGDVERRVAAIQEHRDRLAQERKEAAGLLGADTLALYERVHRGQPDGRAVAAARNYVCSGCNITLPPNMVNHLMRGSRLITCRACQRILYLDEGEAEKA